MKTSRNIKYYFFYISILTAICIFIADLFMMPLYVRHGEGSYMVNVKDKPIDYDSQKIL